MMITPEGQQQGSMGWEWRHLQLPRSHLSDSGQLQEGSPHASTTPVVSLTSCGSYGYSCFRSDGSERPMQFGDFCLNVHSGELYECFWLVGSRSVGPSTAAFLVTMFSCGHCICCCNWPETRCKACAKLSYLFKKSVLIAIGKSIFFSSNLRKNKGNVPWRFLKV